VREKLCVKKGRIIEKDKTDMIFLHNNAPWHTSTMVQNLETLNWEVLPHPTYLPDLASSDYHLSSMGHTLTERHFDSYEDVRKWLDE